MIKVYFLPVETAGGVDVVAGINIMHDALLECTEQPDTRKLIMNTTESEHNALYAVAVETREATPDEIHQYDTQVIITPPDPETIRAEELLKNSPQVITQPEMWELMRIFGRRLGYDF